MVHVNVVVKWLKSESQQMTKCPEVRRLTAELHRLR